jgi:hypothetical protein
MAVSGRDTKETIELAKKGIVNTSKSAFRHLSADAKNFIISLMNKEPTKRLTAP